MQDQYNTIAKFLEAKGMPEEALEVATDNGGRANAGRMDTWVLAWALAWALAVRLRALLGLLALRGLADAPRLLGARPRAWAKASAVLRAEGKSGALPPRRQPACHPSASASVRPCCAGGLTIPCASCVRRLQV